MKLKEILPPFDIGDIQIRCKDPFGEDILYGVCNWDGEKLISVDGDSYSIEDEISDHKFDSKTKQLICWIEVEWSRNYYKPIE